MSTTLELNRQGEPRCPVCGHFLNDDGAEGWICSKRGGCGSEWHHETLFGEVAPGEDTHDEMCRRLAQDNANLGAALVALREQVRSLLDRFMHDPASKMTENYVRRRYDKVRAELRAMYRGQTSDGVNTRPVREAAPGEKLSGAAVIAAARWWWDDETNTWEEGLDDEWDARRNAAPVLKLAEAAGFGDVSEARAALADRTAELEREIAARKVPPHMDGPYREGIFRGLVLARHLLGGPCDPDECASHERDLVSRAALASSGAGEPHTHGTEATLVCPECASEARQEIERLRATRKD